MFRDEHHTVRTHVFVSKRKCSLEHHTVRTHQVVRHSIICVFVTHNKLRCRERPPTINATSNKESCRSLTSLGLSGCRPNVTKLPGMRRSLSSTRSYLVARLRHLVWITLPQHMTPSDSNIQNLIRW